MFTIKRETLLNALQKLQSIVQAQQTMPVLSYIRLEVTSHSLKLYATDLEVELIAHLTIEKGPSQTTTLMLPAKKLFDICKALPEASTIQVTNKDTKILVSSGRSRFTLATLVDTEFPALSAVEDEQWEIKLNQKNFLSLLKSTYFAMGAQDVRYYLNGLLLELYQNSICAVATDGHRLALNRVPAKINNDEHKIQIIVPNKSVIELMRHLEPNDTEINLLISASRLIYKTAAYTFKTKLIDARFPNYECALPIGLDKKVTVPRETFRQLLARVAILSNNKIHGVKLELKTNLLQVSAFNNDHETAVEDLPVDYNGAEAEIAFNVRYLLDVVQSCSSSHIELGLKDGATSMLVKESGVESQAMFVLMPLCLFQHADSEYTSN